MNTPDDWTPEERRLHDALSRAADQVTPGPDGLAQIRRRTAVVPLWRRPVVLGLAGATALAAAVIVGGAIVLSDSDDAPVATTTSSPSRTPLDDPVTDPTDGVPTPDPTEAPTEAPTDAPSEEPTETEPAQALNVPVYYVADAGDGQRLAREFQTVETADPPVLAALRQVGAPADPDNGSIWQPDQILSAEVGDDAITVDVTEFPTVDSGGGEPSNYELAVQQIVYTATAAAATHDLDGSLPVRFTVAGEPVDAFGEVDLSEPVGRADPLAVRQLVQLNEPAEGATVTSPVTFSGEAAVFEANVLWEIRQDGAVVDNGNTTTTECCTFAEFTLDVELEPGTYEIVMSETDPSGGEGRPPMSDSKTFTVE